MKDIQFQGIVAVGTTRNQAISRYRMLAMGKGATCFVDSGNSQAFVSNASSDLENVFNPTTGNMDLEQSEEALENLQFTAKAGDVHEAFHYQCTAGCGSHLVYDNEGLVKNCPVCSTAVANDESAGDEDEDTDDLDDAELDSLDEELEDEEESDEDAEEEGDDEDQEATASELDDEDADDSDSDDDSDEEELEDEDDSEDDESTDDTDDSEDDASDEEEDEDDSMNDAPLVVAASSRDEAISQFSRLAKRRMVATASSDSVVNAHYMVCASDEGCGAHVVAAVELTDCPRGDCGHALADPEEATAGSDTEGSMSLFTEDDTDEDEDADTGADDNAGDDADADADADSDEDEGDTSDDDTEEKQKAEASADDEESNDDEQQSDEELDEVEADLLDQLPEDVDVADIDVAFASSIAGGAAWTAYHKGVPFAVATASTIQPDHAPMFTTNTFGSAAISASKVGGAKKVLSQMGFKGIVAKLSVPKHVETRVTALASDATAALATERAEFTERFMAAMATAAIGINRGFFQGVANPVRDSMLTALSSVGVRNPEPLVDGAMNGGFEVMLRSVFDRAADIMSKPLEVQESLARTVLDISYKPKSDLPLTATASAMGSSLDDRLAGVGTAVASAQTNEPAKTETAVAAASDDSSARARMQKAMGMLGRR